MMLSRQVLRTPKGLGDVNSDAQAKFAAAGYTGVTCAPQTVDYPGGSYTINQCTDNQGVSMSADIAANMTVAQIAAQLTQENAPVSTSNTRTGNLNIGPGGSAIFPFLTSSGVPATNQNEPGYTQGGIYGPSGAPPAYIGVPGTGAQQQQASQVPASATQSSQNILNPTSAGSETLAPSAGFNLGPSTIITGIPDLVVYGAGGLAALFLVMSMGGKHH